MATIEEKLRALDPEVKAKLEVWLTSEASVIKVAFQVLETAEAMSQVIDALLRPTRRGGQLCSRERQSLKSDLKTALRDLQLNRRFFDLAAVTHAKAEEVF